MLLLWCLSMIQVISLSFRPVYAAGHIPDTLCFQLLFLSIILLLSEFFIEALHDDSLRILSFFNCSSSFLSKLWSIKLYSKVNMVLNTCFVLRSSRILHLAFQSAIISTLSFEVVIYHSSFTRMRYFKSTNLFIGVILCHVSPKAFPKDCCYLRWLWMTQVLH